MKQQLPAIDGWFTDDADGPRLIGSRGVETGSYFFPKALAVSANPAAPTERREDVLLSRRGTVWSFTTNHYQPPEPYMSPDPFEPYSVLAVELAEEQMVVLGQLAAGVDPSTLTIGMEVQLVFEPLFEDDDYAYMIWKWRPA
ncbi:MAG TPA: OB-fold domain-containing protein [Acidimicrobiia bacterium]|nr:OB-fold domain-containing protein [Acidimicrobiia bacterium]